MVKTETEKPKSEDQKTLEPETEEQAVDLSAGYEGEMDESDRAGGTGQRITNYFMVAQRGSDKPQVAEQAGKFYFKNDEGDYEFYNSLDVIALESINRGVRFADGAVACRSYDGKVGTCGKTCKECEYHQFIENNIPKEKKCKGSMVILCLSADNEEAEPFFLQIGAGNIRDWKDYASELQNRHSRPIFSVITRITTVEKKFDLGKSFVAEFKAIKALNSKEDYYRLRDRRVAESYRFKPQEAAEGVAAAEVTNGHDAPAADVVERDPFVSE